MIDTFDHRNLIGWALLVITVVVSVIILATGCCSTSSSQFTRDQLNLVAQSGFAQASELNVGSFEKVIGKVQITTWRRPGPFGHEWVIVAHLYGYTDSTWRTMSAQDMIRETSEYAAYKRAWDYSDEEKDAIRRRECGGADLGSLPGMDEKARARVEQWKKQGVLK